MSASIFHLRMKDFELQAERVMDPALRTRPIAVISSHHQNGTIISLSHEAREEGLYPGMKLSLARKISHSALLLPYNRSLYNRLNHYLYQTVSHFSPIVEPEYFGRFYLDMTGMGSLYESLKQAGHLIMQSVTNKTCLTGTVGISANKLVSRISTTVVPESIYEVPRGSEAHFLSPLHTPVLPVAHERKVKKMIRFLFLNRVEHIQTITASRESALTFFRDHARQLFQESRGLDMSVVRPPAHKNHILKQIVLPADTNQQDLLETTVKTLAEQVAFQLRRQGQISKRLKLEIHYTDGFKSVKKGSVDRNDDASILQVCRRLFELANYRRNRIRTLLIDADRLKCFAHQLDLFSSPEIQNRALSIALDKIRRRYGCQSIRSANSLKLAG